VIRVCPRCRGLSQNTFLCPKCGTQTQEVESPGASDSKFGSVMPDPPTFAGGVLLGLLVSQGLTYALRHITTAVVLAQDGSASDAGFWSSFQGWVAVQTIQATALFFSAIFAGAGQRMPLLVGLVLGALNALLFMMFSVVVRQPIDPLMYAQPVVHAAVAAIGCIVGRRIWQPAPPLPALASAAVGPGEEELTIVLEDEPEIIEAEPLPWARFLLGAAIAVGGTIGARWIRDFVVIAGGGTGHEMQSNFITWQIAALAQVIGGIVTGSNSRSGAMYGFWTGILAAALIIVIPALRDAPAPAVSAWILGSAAESRPAAFLVQGIQALILGFFGGWLGALILPPAAQFRPLSSADR
jgi:hypothetical protein